MKVRRGVVEGRPGRVTLTAFDDSGDVARLEGEFVMSTLFQARRGEIGGGTRAPEAWAAFAMHLADAFEARGGEVLVWEGAEQDRWCAALEGAGFRRARRKAFVTRELTSDLPVASLALRLRSLGEVGERAFLERMIEASQGDPYEDREGSHRDYVREWAELIEHAGERFDPAGWYLVDDDAGPVGVLLPQADDDATGTLSYIGVVPSRRGHGLGRELHATGLSLLAGRGKTRYIGSTDLRNAPMLRVFERNGCRVKGTQAYYAIAPRAGAPDLADRDGAESGRR